LLYPDFPHGKHSVFAMGKVLLLVVVVFYLYLKLEEKIENGVVV